MIVHIVLFVWGLGILPSLFIIAKRGLKDDLGTPLEGDALLSALRSTTVSEWSIFLLFAVIWPISFAIDWFIHKMLGY